MDAARQAVMFEASTTGILLVLAALFFAPGHTVPSVDASQPAVPAVVAPLRNPQELVRRMVQNELMAEKDDSTHWRFRKFDAKAGKSQTWEVVETKNGEVQRLIAVDGHPLDEEQQKAEQARIRKFVNNAEEQEEKKNASSSDFKKEQSLMEMLPNALIYDYAGERNGLIELMFRPNPSFHASTREAEVFHHMTGELWISKGSLRLSQLRGRLASRVSFGGGLLGHLDKGGTFDVKQADVGDGHWDVTLLNTDLTGKALFFKTIAVHEKVIESGYHRVSDELTLQQAAQLLNRDNGHAALTAEQQPGN
jgi:hypothetical protein